MTAAELARALQAYVEQFGDAWVTVESPNGADLVREPVGVEHTAVGVRIVVQD